MFCVCGVLCLCVAVFRPDGAADVRYAECSMKNGFGLMHLHKFLSIPFLQLQVHIVCTLCIIAQSSLHYAQYTQVSTYHPELFTFYTVCCYVHML